MDNKDLNAINRDSWDLYQADYMKFQLMARPDYYEFFAQGGVDLDSYLPDMIGDVRGLELLDTCCAADAVQAFSWHNLGARVTACDITPEAIRIASENAAKLNLDVEFACCDMQTLLPIADWSMDIVFATYPVWLSDLDEACVTWHRVLRDNGRLLLHAEHPITHCIGERDGKLMIRRNYNEKATEVYETFEGTPLADQFGGWSAMQPSVEHFYRISDIVNAICAAGFHITKIFEAPNSDSDGVMRKLPSDFAVVAQKRL